jgi:hypothetical protein
LNALEADVEDPGQSADHQRLGETGYALEQAVAASENGCKQLLDHVLLSDNDTLQFLLHHLPVMAEFLQHVAQAALFGGHMVDCMCRSFARQGVPLAVATVGRVVAALTVET